MSAITPSVAPGFYLDPQLVSFTFDADVVSVAKTTTPAQHWRTMGINLTTGSRIYVLMKKGYGKAHFVGTAEAFFNGTAGTNITDYNSLPNYRKYLVNLFKYVKKSTDPTNNKILIIGDVEGNTDVGVKATHPAGLKTSLDNLCTHAGLVPTYRTPLDYADGLITESLAYLQSFSVVLFAAAGTIMTIDEANLPSRIFKACVENGVGFLFVSNDRGAQANYLQFTNTFGLSLNMDGNSLGTTQTVAAIKAVTGNHDLYNGLNDSGQFFALTLSGQPDGGNGFYFPDIPTAPPPSLSKYIAYDNLEPRNPFIAITEDGRGRVVYDGGFPKFYNDYAPAANATFTQLTGSFKFLHNALKWCANPTKVAAGNNKVLIIGDAISGEPYNVVDSTSNNFFTSLSRICTIAGFSPSFRTRANYAGGIINLPLSELEQYGLVILMSTTYLPGSNFISDQCVNELVTYRENNNGIIMITDHGPDIINIGLATVNRDGFFNMCNRVAVKFGAFFTGNYDRTPVSLQFIRDNYGDHPLYANISNAEFIVAGGSESKVVVAPNTSVPKNSFPPIPVDVPGFNVINLLVTKADSSVESFKFVYAIADGEFLFLRNPSNVVITVDDLGTSNQSKFTIAIDGSLIGTVWGVIELNGVRVGTMTWDSTYGTQVRFFTGGTARRVKDKEVYTVKIMSPFTYSKDITIDRFDTDLPPTKTLSLAAKAQKLASNFTTLVASSRIGKVKELAETVIGTYVLPAAVANKPKTSAEAFKRISEYENNLLEQEALYQNMKVFDLKSAAQVYMNANLPAPLDYLFVCDEDSVYAYSAGSWVRVAGLTILNAVGTPREIRDLVSGFVYSFNSSKKLVRITSLGFAYERAMLWDGSTYTSAVGNSSLVITSGYEFTSNLPSTAGFYVPLSRQVKTGKKFIEFYVNDNDYNQIGVYDYVSGQLSNPVAKQGITPGWHEVKIDYTLKTLHIDDVLIGSFTSNSELVVYGNKGLVGSQGLTFKCNRGNDPARQNLPAGFSWF